MLFEAGKNPKQVQEWLGHADPAFTLPGPAVTEARQKKAKANVEAARLTWAQRRATLATRLGDAATAFLERAIDAKPQEARNLMVAFGIAVEKGQLLDGGATERIERLTAEQMKAKVQEIRDELASRRGARAA